MDGSEKLWSFFKKYSQFPDSNPNNRLFSFIQNHYYILGIFSKQSNDNVRSFNFKYWFCVIYLSLYYLAFGAFFIIGRKSMYQYEASFFATTLGIYSFVVYLTVAKRSENTLKFFENCKRFIEKSKFITSYTLWDRDSKYWNFWQCYVKRKSYTQTQIWALKKKVIQNGFYYSEFFFLIWNLKFVFRLKTQIILVIFSFE